MTPTEHPPTAPQAMGASRHYVLWQRSGVMVVLDISGPHLPRALYWGADLGPL